MLALQWAFLDSTHYDVVGYRHVQPQTYCYQYLKFTFRLGKWKSQPGRYWVDNITPINCL